MDQGNISSNSFNAEIETDDLRSLPNDLADFVSCDNNEFQVEKDRWDEDQEAKKKKQKQEEQEMVTDKDGDGVATGGNGDVMVVQEKLT
jgi:nucleoside-specific outer membrane channel protein Tsx